MQIPALHFRLVGVALLALLAAAAPYLAWRLESPRALEVVIVDKTVPFRNYREHAAAPWLLHAMKIQNAAGRFLDPAHDYLGYDPENQRGRDVSAVSLASADVLFIADTFGVYAGDFERSGEQAALERSPKIYGGLTEDEARAVEEFSSRGGMVIGEFNTFASPTGLAARERLEAVFGVRWTRWVVRYWPDLADQNDVPRWIGRLYQRVAGAPLEVHGGGLVFIKEDSDIVVLRRADDLGAGIVSQERTAGGAVFGFPETGSFHDWMDVIEANGSEVLYEHVVDATPAGEQKLAAHGLSRRFPALTRRWDAWYFAGDFVDNAVDLGNPERAWILPCRRARAMFGGSADQRAFWGWYAPIVSRLFVSRARSP